MMPPVSTPVLDGGLDAAGAPDGVDGAQVVLVAARHRDAPVEVTPRVVP